MSEMLPSQADTITDEELREVLKDNREHPAPKPFARWKIALIIVGAVLMAMSVAMVIVLGILVLKQGNEIVGLQKTGNALAASNKNLSIASLHSQNNHHASTVKAQQAAAAQANVIIGLQEQLLAAHTDTETLLMRLAQLTTEASTLGPALTQGQSALNTNIAAIDFQEAEIRQEVATLQSEVAALQAVVSGSAK